MTIADKGGAEGGVRQMMTIDDEGGGLSLSF